MNFTYIVYNTIYDYVNFDPTTRNLFFNGFFRFVQTFNSACPEVSQYLNR